MRISGTSTTQATDAEVTTAVSDHNALATAHAAIMPSTVFIMPMHTPVASVGTWAVSGPPSVTEMKLSMIHNEASHAINDSASFDVALSAGTWKITLNGYKSTAAGKASVFLDGVDTGTTLDSYVAVPEFGLVNGSATFTVATSGIKRLAFKVAAKNAASSDYYFYIGPFLLTRTA